MYIVFTSNLPITCSLQVRNDPAKVASWRKANQRDKELELKKLELQLQERKFALEEEERWKRLENEVERQRIEAEERKTIYIHIRTHCTVPIYN